MSVNVTLGDHNMVVDSVSDYAVRRHPTYRAMKESLNSRIAALEAEVTGLRAGVLGQLPLKDITKIPFVADLRERHKALTEKNKELRQELARAMPTRYQIERSEPYRKLRKQCDDLNAEWRALRKERKALQWLETSGEMYRETSQWATKLLAVILPAKSLEPEGMALWHLEQSALWAGIAGVPLTRLQAILRYMREDGLDVHQGYRSRAGSVPAALRRDLLHEEAQCARCGSTEALTIDHIHPVLHGGTHDADNLQVLCRSCNSAKGAKLEQ